MDFKKGAPSGASPIEGDETEMKNQIDITEYIPMGIENAITRKELQDLLHIPDRDIRLLIQEARKETPILSVGKGYFRPRSDNPEDVRAIRKWIVVERSRAKSIIKGLKSAEEFLDMAEGESWSC